jgi:hypothetical protein
MLFVAPNQVSKMSDQALQVVDILEESVGISIFSVKLEQELVDLVVSMSVLGVLIHEEIGDNAV